MEPFLVASVRCVSTLAIRRRLRRHQRRLALVAAVLVLSGLTAAHHGGPLMDMQHDVGMSAAIEMCLAVFTAIGGVVAALGCGGLAVGRRRATLRLLGGGPLTIAPVPVARARHGPAAVSVLCVSRR